MSLHVVVIAGKSKSKERSKSKDRKSRKKSSKDKKKASGLKAGAGAGAGHARQGAEALFERQGPSRQPWPRGVRSRAQGLSKCTQPPRRQEGMGECR